MKTRATIDKLNVIVMQKYESYRTRRVPISLPASNTLKQNAQLRLNALRELMRAEMPDGFLDIADTANANPKFLSQWPGIRATYSAALTAARSAPIYSATSKHEQSAYCLYLLVTKGSGDPDVMEQFADNEIATGDDGLRYFVDGWGMPIRFLRWAPAFRSPLQKGPDKGELDPFDPANVSATLSPAQSTFPLFPLIYSAGPDKKYDIGEQPSGGANYATIDNSPFHASVKDLIGNYQDLDQPPDSVNNSIDNITNHDGD